MKRIICLFCALLTVLLLAGRVSDADAGPTNLSRHCAYATTASSVNTAAWLGDRDLKTRVILAAGEWASVTWEPEVPADFVYWEWTDDAGVLPAPFTVSLLDAAGKTVRQYDGDRYWNDGTAIEPGVCGVRLTAVEDTELCTLVPFEGGAPSDRHAWEPTPEKADFLVIATHPDDDALNMGNVIATYGKQLGYTGTILWCCTRERVRRTEALNGAAVMGLTQYPLMAGLPDISQRNRSKYENRFLLEDVENTIIRYLRQVKPEVVVTHDVDGEYGHWQHKRVSEAVRLAVEDAANPAFDPASAELYGTWQVKKLYIHLYPQNTVFISATEPLSAFGGMTGWEIAKAAYGCHLSQELSNHPCNNEGVHSLEKFGLAFTTVGPDTPGHNDLLENIPKEALTVYSPASIPTVTPIPAPTETPTPASTTTPSSTLPAAPTPILEVKETVAPAVKTPQASGVLPWIVLGSVSTALLILLMTIYVLRRRKRRK